MKKTGISYRDAQALWELAEYAGYKKGPAYHPPQKDSYQGGEVLHLKINGMHINIYGEEE